MHELQMARTKILWLIYETTFAYTCTLVHVHVQDLECVHHFKYFLNNAHFMHVHITTRMTSALFTTENAELKDGKLTLDGFLHLNEMEAEDAEEDPEELWVTLAAWGFNKALEQDEVRAALCSSMMVAMRSC